MVNILELRPAQSGSTSYVDIVIDSKPLAHYFTGRLGAHPSEISPLGWADADHGYRVEPVKRLLLEVPPDLPDGRTSVLVCEMCGHIDCGAYGVQIRRDGVYVHWEDWDDLGIGWPEIPPDFLFCWDQYERELRRHLRAEARNSSTQISAAIAAGPSSSWAIERLWSSRAWWTLCARLWKRSN